jgi:DNA-binding MarR family transcriptional regulator
MPKLNDTQTMLLSHASQRDSRSLHPLPDRFAATGPRVTKAINDLVKAALLELRETSDLDEIAHRDGDLDYGIYVTETGLAAIGVDGPDSATASTPPAPAEPLPVAEKQPRQTKAALIVGMLRVEGGATLKDLIAATGWLPHTTRAALTGLRKKGRAIVKGQRDGATCYAIAEVA